LNCLGFLKGVLGLLFVSRNLLTHLVKEFHGFLVLLLSFRVCNHQSFWFVCRVFFFVICCIFLIFYANANSCSLFVIIHKFLDDRSDPLNHKTRAHLFFLKLLVLPLQIQKVGMRKPQNIFHLYKGDQVACHLF
jgi:hypothetical protein